MQRHRPDRRVRRARRSLQRRPRARPSRARRCCARRYSLAYMGFMALNAYELVTLGGFMFFWGWVFLGSTLWVLLEKQEWNPRTVVVEIQDVNQPYNCSAFFDSLEVGLLS